jgi:multicomponent Na+:H+ antiporter subunit D
MPVTMAAFTVGALSMIGVPPTCGFFSKWYLILGAVEAGAWGYMAALLFSSLVNVVLFFRIIEIAFFEGAGAGGSHGHGHGEGHGGGAGAGIDEAPASMAVPLALTAAVLIAVGLASGVIVECVIGPFVAAMFGGG